MTLANQITILRIVLIPVIVICLIANYLWAVVIFLGFSLLTDLLDGIVARRRGEQTQLGAFLDPMADKLLLTSVFLTLTCIKEIPIWVFVVVFSRDLLIVLGWAVIYILTSSPKITPRPMGKIATAVQMSLAMGVILHVPEIFQHILVWSTVAVTAVSAIDYIIVGEKRLGEWG
jgi:cardiolipin synthase